jgi:hypothetical protein
MVTAREKQLTRLAAVLGTSVVFLDATPLVLVTVMLVARGVPGTASAGTAGRLDFAGVLLAALALSGSVFAAVTLLQEHNFTIDGNSRTSMIPG